MVRLNRLMESDQPSLQGAARSAIWLFAHAPQRSRWVDLAHLTVRFLAPARLRYVSLVVNQTTAQNLSCQQSPKTGQTIRSNHESL